MMVSYEKLSVVVGGMDIYIFMCDYFFNSNKLLGDIYMSKWKEHELVLLITVKYYDC